MVGSLTRYSQVDCIVYVVSASSYMFNDGSKCMDSRTLSTSLLFACLLLMKYPRPQYHFSNGSVSCSRSESIRIIQFTTSSTATSRQSFIDHLSSLFSSHPLFLIVQKRTSCTTPTPYAAHLRQM